MTEQQSVEALVQGARKLIAALEEFDALRLRLRDDARLDDLDHMTIEQDVVNATDEAIKQCEWFIEELTEEA